VELSEFCDVTDEDSIEAVEDCPLFKNQNFSTHIYIFARGVYKQWMTQACNCKFLALKLKVSENSFRTATLKH
jgi:hypothetical protein